MHNVQIYCKVRQQIVSSDLVQHILEALAEVDSLPAAPTQAALHSVRNLSRDPPSRAALVQVGCVAMLLEYAGAAHQAAIRVAAVEVLINLSCLLQNKSRILEAGAARVLVACLQGDVVADSIDLKEVALECMACLSFFFEQVRTRRGTAHAQHSRKIAPVLAYG